jgi:hypothetical protein
VSFTTFESFVNMKNRFHSDTAYVLFYQKFDPAAAMTSAKVPLRPDLQVHKGGHFGLKKKLILRS